MGDWKEYAKEKPATSGPKFVTIDEGGNRRTEVAEWRDGRFDVPGGDAVVAWMDVVAPEPYVVDKYPDGWLLPSTSETMEAAIEGVAPPSRARCKIAERTTVFGRDYVRVYVDGRPMKAPTNLVTNDSGRSLAETDETEA